MARITVDQERCKQCGICSKICPAGIIVMNGKGSFPFVPEASEMRCISCGHCETACPEAGLTVIYSSTVEAARHTGKWGISPEQLGLYMRGRRSIRHFRKRVVSREIFEELMDIARFAPSAGNGQPVRWIVVQNPQEVRRLTQVAVDWLRQLPADAPMRAMFSLEMSNELINAWQQGVDIICRNAPHLVIAHAGTGARMPVVDGTIALTYLDLAAPAFGLGACWAGFFYMFLEASPQLREAVGIPSQHKPLGALMLGYPKYKHHQIPRRNRANVTWKSSSAIEIQS